MNVPDWLNTNQLCGLLAFCCIVLSGMHLELDTVCVVNFYQVFYKECYVRTHELVKQNERFYLM